MSDRTVGQKTNFYKGLPCAFCQSRGIIGENAMHALHDCFRLKKNRCSRCKQLGHTASVCSNKRVISDSADSVPYAQNNVLTPVFGRGHQLVHALTQMASHNHYTTIPESEKHSQQLFDILNNNWKLQYARDTRTEISDETLPPPASVEKKHDGEHKKSFAEVLMS